MRNCFHKIRMRIFMTTFALFFTGCSLQKQNQDILGEDYEIVNTEEDSLYFSRDYSNVLQNSDYILTLEEKGIDPISDYAKDIISKISSVNSYLFDFSWVNLFEIEDYYDLAYTDPNVVNFAMKHTNSKYYDEKNDSIFWNKLVDQVYQNSLVRVEQDRNLLENEDTANNYKGLEALGTKEIKVVMKQLQSFTESVKKQYPNYDMEHFACQLANLSLTYRTKIDEKDSTILATTSSFEIQWYLNSSSQYPDLSSSILLNEHEFKHLLCGYCCDDLKSYCYIVPSGVVYQGHEALRFTFIEEATAEQYSTSRNGLSTLTYYEKLEILDNLQFVLSLQDDYREDAFLEYSFLKNPLAMVQQFPVLEDQEYYFVNILKMLASYNAVVTNSYEFIGKVNEKEGYKDFYKEPEKKKQVYSSLTNYAGVELSRLFFTNLIVMNEEKTDMTLEYNFYLMRLFEKRMQISFDVISDYQRINVSSANYWQSYEENLGFLFQYLSSRYQIENKNIRELYKEFSLSEKIVYPSFVDQSKIEFYQELSNREYDVQELRETMKEKMKSYVIYTDKK